MTAWMDRILKEFSIDMAWLWIVADPDGVLLNERVLFRLRERDFEVLPFEDSVVFRADYEERYRAARDQGQSAPSSALILHLHEEDAGGLPWDYLRQARRINLSLAELFPNLSRNVVRCMDGQMLEALFDVQERYPHQSLGEASTKEFILTHIFGIDLDRITGEDEFWRQLLRLHYRNLELPPLLAAHVEQVVGERSAFKSMQITELFSQKSLMVRVVQDAWHRYLIGLGLTDVRVAESPPEYAPKIDISFDYHDIRVIVDSMFLDGTLRPLPVSYELTGLPDWTKVGVIRDQTSMRNLVIERIRNLVAEIPAIESSYRDWIHFSLRLGEIMSRFHRLESGHAESIKETLRDLVVLADDRLWEWVKGHYADLPSLPVAKNPVMVHHVPRYLAMRRDGGEEKIALLVFDGLAIDQWIQIRDGIIARSERLMFDENACFAWLPTLTSVSRQALFSGLRPREFADSIGTTSRESSLWAHFWQDHGLEEKEVFYRKSIKRTDDLPALESMLANSAVKVAGIVVDMVDEIVHGAVLGKRGISTQIASWCESGFVDRLFSLLLDNGLSVYLTSDHGNAEAVGIGRLNQGVASDLRGERVRIYRSEALISATASANPDTIRLDVAGLPTNFMPLFARRRGAFVPKGEQVVVHGGVSVEELLVPFVKVSDVH